MNVWSRYFKDKGLLYYQPCLMVLYLKDFIRLKKFITEQTQQLLADVNYKLARTTKTVLSNCLVAILFAAKQIKHVSVHNIDNLFQF